MPSTHELSHVGWRKNQRHAHGSRRMARVSTEKLWRYLLRGQLTSRACLGEGGMRSRTGFRWQSTATCPSASATVSVPFRKELKEKARAAKACGAGRKKKTDKQTVPGWELRVGIEMHAQLNTARKLFSPAASSSGEAANSQVAIFDAAVPGSQPVFEVATVIPAVRAALALGCRVRRVSRWDRKHYFHWDQPAGYQITQQSSPLAEDGVVELRARDGIAAEDGDRVLVRVRQVHMEQDSAKTTAAADGGQWIDLNRAGVPLVEIVTHPDIRHPATAAALVRKVQMLLRAVDACVLGMEAGGLRADVNVSVRTLGQTDGQLGTRTEIKNLSSFRAVEEAIIAERDRQIALLEAGGVVCGETRGWTLGSTDTRRLRGKEGEVDYRYMPEPDLGPVIIGDDLLAHLQSTLAPLPDAEADMLISQYGLEEKDALSLMRFDDGARIDYFYDVLQILHENLAQDTNSHPSPPAYAHARLVANWCLHELGKLTSSGDELGMTASGTCRVPAADLAAILTHLQRRRITAKVAKELLWGVYRGSMRGGVTAAVDAHGWWFEDLDHAGYFELAKTAIESEETVLREFVRFAEGETAVYPRGKLMFLVGKMMRAGPEQRMDPVRAESVLKACLDGYVGGLVKTGARQ